MGKMKNILISAMDCARDKNYRMMTRQDIAEYADVSEALVSHYLGSMDDIREMVMKAAVELEDVHILAQGLFFRDPIATSAPASLKSAAIRTVCIEGGVDVQ